MSRVLNYAVTLLRCSSWRLLHFSASGERDPPLLLSQWFLPVKAFFWGRFSWADARPASHLPVSSLSPQLSPTIVEGLHNIARSIESRAYAEGLNIHTHIVSNSNFSETSAFMPVLKVVLTQANKLGVWSSLGPAEGEGGVLFFSFFLDEELWDVWISMLNSSLCHPCFATQLKHTPRYRWRSVVKETPGPSHHAHVE